MDNLITCYRCGGAGEIYKYELNLGPSSKCPGCQGHGSISSNSCYKCIKCKGTGKIYEYAEETGQRIECPLCNNKGYTTERYIECLKCKGEGKLYPFPSEKLGVPKKCNNCNSFGYIKEKSFNNVHLNQNENKINTNNINNNLPEYPKYLDANYCNNNYNNNNYNNNYNYIQTPGQFEYQNNYELNNQNYQNAPLFYNNNFFP